MFSFFGGEAIFFAYFYIYFRNAQFVRIITLNNRFKQRVDWSGRHLTPAGRRGKVETPEAKPRRLDFLPAESKCLERKGTVKVKNEKQHSLRTQKMAVVKSAFKDFLDSPFLKLFYSSSFLLIFLFYCIL